MNQNQIAEGIDFNLNLTGLLEELEQIKAEFPPIMRSQNVGGWALQGAKSPSYKEGWSFAFCPYNGPLNRGPTWTPQSEEERNSPPIQDYTIPTEAAKPQFRALLEHLEALGLNPRRARIILLKPNSTMVWHQDGSPRIYQTRLHIPLVTNENCFFENDSGKAFMPADGSGYLVPINNMHRAANLGDSIRYHFVAHVWDQRGLTQHHRYEASQCDFETVHAEQIAPGSLIDFSRK